MPSGPWAPTASSPRAPSASPAVRPQAEAGSASPLPVGVVALALGVSPDKIGLKYHRIRSSRDRTEPLLGLLDGSDLEVEVHGPNGMRYPS